MVNGVYANYIYIKSIYKTSYIEESIKLLDFLMEYGGKTTAERVNIALELHEETTCSAKLRNNILHYTNNYILSLRYYTPASLSYITP